MMVAPRNEKEWNAMAQFLQLHAGVAPSMDLKLLGWVVNDRLEIVVGFNGWMGRICQGHVAVIPEVHFCPRVMMREVFHYVFDIAKREMLVVTYNSLNRRAVKMDAQLGFVELLKLHGMHDDGGDLVILGMTRQSCRYYDGGIKRGEPERIHA